MHRPGVPRPVELETQSFACKIFTVAKFKILSGQIYASIGAGPLSVLGQIFRLFKKKLWRSKNSKNTT
jgi:hypothetical protein